MSFKFTYKSYSKKTVFLDSLPLKKISNFKKSKWKFVARFLKQKKNWKLKFFDFRKINVKQKPIPRTRNTYSTGLMLRRSLNNYCNNSFNIQLIKKYLYSKNNSMLNILLVPLFKLDILLWKLQLYQSTKQVKQDIKCKLIKVNDTFIDTPPILKKGSVITILKDKFYTRSLFPMKSFFYSFCEIDFYSQNLIIIKNSIDFFNGDTTLLLKKNVNIKNLFFYLHK